MALPAAGEARDVEANRIVFSMIEKSPILRIHVKPAACQGVPDSD